MTTPIDWKARATELEKEMDEQTLLAIHSQATVKELRAALEKAEAQNAAMRSALTYIAAQEHWEDCEAGGQDADADTICTCCDNCRDCMGKALSALSPDAGPAYIERIRAEERERCAKVALGQQTYGHPEDCRCEAWCAACTEIATIIRREVKP